MVLFNDFGRISHFFELLPLWILFVELAPIIGEEE